MPNGDLFKDFSLDDLYRFQDRFHGTPVEGAINKLTYGAQSSRERESLRFTDKEKEQYISELLRSVGTLQSQQLNRASETAARTDLPIASQLAQERGVAIRGNEAVQKGTFDIEMLQKSTNRQALQFLMDLAFRREALKAQIDQQNKASGLGLLGDIGQVGGFLAAGALTGGTSAVAGGGTAAPLYGWCWVAAEIFNGWEDIRTKRARAYVINDAPKWFKLLYGKYGERVAKFIHNKRLLKWLLKPLFLMFANKGEIV